MLILTIKTDNPTAELGLFNYQTKLDYLSYEAHRLLAETINIQIKKLLEAHDYDYPDLGGVICFKGPGSFTGLRIGLSVANTLAYGLDKPIIGAKTEDWIKLGIKELLAGKNQKIVLPFYGQEPHITKQQK